MSIEIYEAGATIELWAHVRDWGADPMSPDQGTKITITDAIGSEKVTSASMSQSSEGELVYRYNIPTNAAKGSWRYQCKGQDGTGGDTRYTVKSGAFRVK